MPRNAPQLDRRHHAAAYRILDANFNRCTEGLRVVEEYARFVLDAPQLTRTCKQLRHDLSDLLRQVPAHQLHAMRDVPGDVGTNVSTKTEYQRLDLRDVAAANMKRVEQSLRSIEEYAKVVAPHLTVGIESIRYRAYTLEQAISTLAASRQRLADARLYVLMDGRESIEAFRELALALTGGGVDLLQLRDKQLSDRELFERAKILHLVTTDNNTLFIMNDRIDLALATGADGVHLGQSELPAREARRLLGPDALIGVSTHSIEQARQAVLDGADYLGCGPTFPSSTKTFQQFPGLEYLREVSHEIALPTFAIGGITPRNIGDVQQAGMTRVAVSHCVSNASDPARAARELAASLHA